VTIDLRCGRWQDALADVEMVDAVITDPPYGERTHAGHDRAVKGCRTSQGEHDATLKTALSYASLSPDDVTAFVDSWAPRTRGWFCAMTSDDLIPAYRGALERHGRITFQPLPCVIPGMTVRVLGDGPSTWSVFLIVSRPRAREWASWGTLPGAYITTREGGQHIGGKPLALMRSIVRDYARPGDLVCDPCAGGATTLLAAAIEGRRAIGAEMDPETFAKAQKRIARGYTPTMFADPVPEMKQEPLL
jgi:site-specific DNA-methyltransferase (adenine-specific)